MDFGRLIESAPLWGVYAVWTLVVLFAIYVGFRIGRARKLRRGEEKEGAIGAVVGATLGLLAFMLAFTFGIAASRFDTRRQLLLDEVNAIGTTYLRAGLVPEPHRTEVRDLLRKYVNARADILQRLADFRGFIKESEDLLDRMWPHAEALAHENLKNPDIVSLFVDSMNEMIDLHTKRLTVALYRIPVVIWIALFGVTVLSMTAVGYEFGQSGKANWQISLILALTFSAVIVLIADLDHPGSGSIKVSQQPMIELRNKLHAGMD